jgi:hypothetical protein
MPKPLLGLGFKYFNVILNLGNTGQICALNFVMLGFMIFYLILSQCVKVKIIQKQMRYLNKRLFFSPFLALAYNAFIPISLSIDLNYRHNIDTHDGEIIAHGLTDLLIGYIYVWFPLAILYVIFNTD